MGGRVRWPWIVGALVVVLALFFLVPAWKGYRVYRALDAAGVPDEYVADMQALAQAKADAERAAEQARTAASDAVAGSARAGEQAASCQALLVTCEEQAAKDKRLCTDLADSLAQEKADVEGELDEAEDVIADAARRICCVRRVEDPSVTGYEVEGGTIACVAGGEPVSC